MRFIFKTNYAQDIRLFQHGGQVFWYGLLLVLLLAAPFLVSGYVLSQLHFIGIYSIVFVSRELDGGQVGLEPGRAMYAVYISTTPNPTSGYVYFVDVADVRIIDMPVEDALKLVISMGLVFPEREGGFRALAGNVDQTAVKTLLVEKEPKRTGRRKSAAASANRH